MSPQNGLCFTKLLKIGKAHQDTSFKNPERLLKAH